MGRAIDVDKNIVELKLSRDNHDRRLKLIEDALEEMVQTRVHHVDLHSDTDKEYIDRLKEEELKGEEFTPPVGKRKKTTKVEKSNAEA